MVFVIVLLLLILILIRRRKKWNTEKSVDERNFKIYINIEFKNFLLFRYYVF